MMHYNDDNTNCVFIIYLILEKSLCFILVNIGISKINKNARSKEYKDVNNGALRIRAH